MTPTVPVTVTLASQDGVPYAGVTVRARLDVNEVYQGFVISDVAEAVTDATGVAILNCFPNAPDPTGLGTQGSTYSFRAVIPGGRALDVQARVPNTASRLENILVNNTVVSLDAATLAVLQAQTSATNAANSATAAQAAQTAALATATATMWVSGTNYALGANVISPINLFTYRRKVAGAGATDPSLDPVNWTQLTSSADQIQSSALIASAAGGTANAITAAFAPAITTLVSGMTLYVRAASANTTTTPTFTPNSGTIAAKTIVKGNNLAVTVADILGAGHWLELQYDATLDKWVLLNPATGVSTATSSNDATFADNSFKPASTNWVRGAMFAIAAAAGFASSFGPTGYIKFPSYLGGWVVQWGNVVSSASADVSVTLPLAFPTACYAAFATILSAVTGYATAVNGLSTSGFNLGTWQNSTTRGSATTYWFALGK